MLFINFADIGNKQPSFAIIISSVFADREVKLDGISFCSRYC